MISTLFQNTPSPSFHAIVKAAIQISLCQYEWPLLKLFYANIFPTGICPLALLLIYPSIQPIPSAFLFHLLKFHMTRAAGSALVPAPHPAPARMLRALPLSISPGKATKKTNRGDFSNDWFFSPPPLSYLYPFFSSLHLLAQTNGRGYIPPPPPSHRGKRALQALREEKFECKKRKWAYYLYLP